MVVDAKFLRTPNRTNSEITDSFCVFCQTFVGASPRPAVLQLMENAHACEELPKIEPRVAVNKPSAVKKKAVPGKKKEL